MHCVGSSSLVKNNDTSETGGRIILTSCLSRLFCNHFVTQMFVSVRCWYSYDQFGASLVLRIDPLTDDRLERAWFNRGNFSKVDNFLHKLRSPQGLNLTVVVLGGSMTKGENTAVSWSSYFSRSLRRQYPHAPPIRVHNLAMGGSSSVKCLQMQLQTLREADKEHGIDLIVVEYALNGKTLIFSLF